MQSAYVNVSLAAASLLKIKSAEYSSPYLPPYFSASSTMNSTYTKPRSGNYTDPNNSCMKILRWLKTMPSNL